MYMVSYFLHFPLETKKKSQYIISLYFIMLGKKLTNYVLILLTDLDCHLTDYGLVFMKMMMKLLKSGVMRSVQQELINSYMLIFMFDYLVFGFLCLGTYILCLVYIYSSMYVFLCLNLYLSNKETQYILLGMLSL